jgi:hypothetical protein
MLTRGATKLPPRDRFRSHEKRLGLEVNGSEVRVNQIANTYDPGDLGDCQIAQKRYFIPRFSFVLQLSASGICEVYHFLISFYTSFLLGVWILMSST